MNEGEMNFGEIVSSKIVTISIVLSFLIFLLGGYLLIRDKILDVEKIVTDRSSVSADLVSAIPPVFPAPATLSLFESPTQYGINVPNQQFPDARGETGTTNMSNLKSEFDKAGVGWLRSDVSPSLDRVFHQNVECGITLCDENKLEGYQILGSINTVTLDYARMNLCSGYTWSSNNINEKFSEIFTLEDWRNVVDCVSKRFAGKINAYEIWNEPTIADFIGGYQDGTPEHYFEMLKSAHEIIKTNDPSATVVGLGGLLVYYGTPDGPERIEIDKNFARRVVELGGVGYVDAISLHAYDWGNYREYQRLDAFEENTAFYKTLFNRPVWITETGYKFGESGSQSEFLKFGYSALLNGGADRIFWFALNDHISVPPHPEMDGAYGIVGRPIQEYMKSFISTPKSGLLRIETRPASDVTIRIRHNDTDQELIRQWGVDWERLQTGNYTVEFITDNPGIQLPPSQEILIEGQKITTLLVNPTNGAMQTATTWEELQEGPFQAPALLRVETNPAAEATIMVSSVTDGTTTNHTWGVDWLEFDEGEYDISLSYPHNLINNRAVVIPSAERVTLAKGMTTTLVADLTTGTLLSSVHDSNVAPDFNAGRLRVETQPPAQLDIRVTSQSDPNASFTRQWGIDWERLEAGNYTIQIPPQNPPTTGLTEVVTQNVTIQKSMITEMKIDSNTGTVQVNYIPE